LPAQEVVARAAELVNAAGSVALLVGGARDPLLALADRLAAPMVLTLKGKEGLERENAFQVGQTGLIGNPAAHAALNGADLLLMIGTDFPYGDWYPDGKTVVQVDARGEHIGRRTHVDAGVVGDAALTVDALLERLEPKPDRGHLEAVRETYSGCRLSPLRPRQWVSGAALGAVWASAAPESMTEDLRRFPAGLEDPFAA